MTLLISMAKALALTLTLELVFALVWGLRKEKLGMVVLMNLLTNPAANLLYSFMTFSLGWPRLVPILLLETTVILTEGLCCRDFMKNPWAFVLLCNGFSFTAGILLQRLF